MNNGLFSFGGDNLYKFLAILGVALLISPSFFEKDWQNVELDAIDVRKSIAERDPQVSELEAQIENINAEREEIAKSIRKREAAVGSLYDAVEKRVVEIRKELELLSHTPEPSREKVMALVEQLKSVNMNSEMPGPTYSEMDKQLAALQNRQNEIDRKLRTEDSLLQQKRFEMMKWDTKAKFLEREYFWDLLSRTIGASMTIAGFLLWYGKVQKYVDRNVRVAGSLERKGRLARKKRIVHRLL